MVGKRDLGTKSSKTNEDKNDDWMVGNNSRYKEDNGREYQKSMVNINFEGPYNPAPSLG